MKVRALLAGLAAVAALCVVAPAQAADVTLSTTVFKNGAKVTAGTFAFYGLDADEMKALTKRANKALDAAAKNQDQGGEYTMEMQRTDVGDDGKKSDSPTIELRGLTFAGVNRALRGSHGFMNEMISDSEDHAKRGHGGPWGKHKMKEAKAKQK
jgi:hypothetical protein